MIIFQKIFTPFFGVFLEKKVFKFSPPLIKYCSKQSLVFFSKLWSASSDKTSFPPRMEAGKNFSRKIGCVYFLKPKTSTYSASTIDQFSHTPLITREELLFRRMYIVSRKFCSLSFSNFFSISVIPKITLLLCWTLENLLHGCST